MIERVRPIAEAIAARGGRAVAVGGWVRDELLGRGHVGNDLDVEVFGLSAAELEAVLGEFGEVLRFGRAFGVMALAGLPVDFALPRRDRKVGAGHRGFEVEVTPELSIEQAARRRDLTVNAIARDLLTGEILDPLGGRADLEAGVLRAADPRHFAEDPLRGLRVVQLAARLGMEPDAELIALCRGLDLSELPGERLRGELDRLLLRAEAPGRGLELLRTTHQLRFFPELEALVGVPQDPEWHPEGDVWTHTALALDAAAELRDGAPAVEAAPLMYAVLCHDFGKPATTREADGRILARGHSEAAFEPTRSFLARLRASNALVEQVVALVAHHLAPAQLPDSDAGPRAYRRLARKLAEADVTPALLERVCRADQWGRTTPDARARRFPAGDRFLAAFARLEIPAGGPTDVVQGRHLLARGLAAGPRFGPILDRCRELQDETGWTDPERILDRVLAEP